MSQIKVVSTKSYRVILFTIDSESFIEADEVLKNASKSAGITQQELADKIGKKREDIARELRAEHRLRRGLNGAGR